MSNAEPSASPSSKSGDPPGSAVAASQARLVPAVERAVMLLDTLSAAGHPLALADLARSLALPKSSVHGLLTTLVALGLVRRDAQGQFALGAKPLQWADAFASQSGLLRAFDTQSRGFPALQAETVMLAVLEGADVTYLSCRQGSRALAVNFRVGGRFPAACTSSGKAMLASMPDDRVRALLGAGPLPRLTRHSVPSLAALLRQLDAARVQGYAVDDEETAEGMQCFGAPIHAARQPQAVAAVAVSVIKAGLTAHRREEIVRAITGLAHEISAVLGGAQRPDVTPPAR